MCCSWLSPSTGRRTGTAIRRNSDSSWIISLSLPGFCSPPFMVRERHWCSKRGFLLPHNFENEIDHGADVRQVLRVGMDREPIGPHLFDLVGQNPDKIGVLTGLVDRNDAHAHSRYQRGILGQ